jgi:hypothetical protein
MTMQVAQRDERGPVPVRSDEVAEPALRGEDGWFLAGRSRDERAPWRAYARLVGDRWESLWFFGPVDDEGGV